MDFPVQTSVRSRSLVSADSYCLCEDSSIWKPPKSHWLASGYQLVPSMTTLEERTSQHCFEGQRTLSEASWSQEQVQQENTMTCLKILSHHLLQQRQNKLLGQRPPHRIIPRAKSQLQSSRLKAGGEGDDRGWDGWMVSPMQWTRVWVGSRSWWWMGKPGVLQSMGSQRVGHDWGTELNWTYSLSFGTYNGGFMETLF